MVWCVGLINLSVSRLFAATDLLHHDMHIHEPAVTSEPVQIVHSSDELVVVNKPAGLPVRHLSPRLP